MYQSPLTETSKKRFDLTRPLRIQSYYYKLKTCDAFCPFTWEFRLLPLAPSVSCLQLKLFQDLSRSPSITSLPDDITRFLFYCGSILSKKPNSVNTNFHQNYKKPNIILKNPFHQNLEKLGITIILSKQPPNKNKRLFAKVISHTLWIESAFSFEKW